MRVIAKFVCFIAIFFAVQVQILPAEYEDTVRSESLQNNENRHFVGTSAFMIMNLLPEPPSFFQVNYGYWLTDKDVISAEAITWTYRHPLGIPYGPSLEADSERYPGHVRSWGLGVAYQRFIWSGFYSALHVTPFLQQYIQQAKETARGFQLFMTLRFGYHFHFLDNRVFIEPSVAFTHWPVNTQVPHDFRRIDNRWPNYFLFEPGFHIGYKF